MLNANFWYQMQMTVDLTVEMLLTENSSIHDNGLEAPLMIEGAWTIAYFRVLSECTTNRAKLHWLSPGLRDIGPAMPRKARPHRGTNRHRPSVDNRQLILPARRRREQAEVRP